MKIVKVNYDDLFYVANNMRQEDKEEIFATRWDDDPESMCLEIVNSPHISAYANTMGIDRPIAAIGAVPMWPGVWSVWMFATPEFHKIGKSMTKYVRDIMIPNLRKHGHRAECRSHRNHKKAHRWLEMLGAKRESTLESFGKDKQDFFVYAWHNDPS